MCSRIASWTCDASFLRFLLRIRFFYEKERKMLIFTVTRHLFFPYYSQTSLQRPHWAQRKVDRWGELARPLCQGRHLLLVGKRVGANYCSTKKRKTRITQSKCTSRTETETNTNAARYWSSLLTFYNTKWCFVIIVCQSLTKTGHCREIIGSWDVF